MWLIYALGSALFAGLTSIIAKIGIKKTDSDVATALRTIVVLIFSWIMVFVTGANTDFSQLNVKSISFLVLSGIATGASWLCYFRALQLGDVNKVAPIDKSSTVLSMILAVIILGERLSYNKIIGMLLIFAGTMLMVINKKSGNPQQKGTSWLIYAMLSAVFASLTSILGKIGVSGINSNLGTAIRTIVVLIMSWIVVAIKGKLNETKKIEKRSLCYIFLSGIATGASWLCYYKALQMGEASVVIPIDKLSILITTLFSYLVLKERLNKRSIFGLVILTLGTLIIIK